MKAQQFKAIVSDANVLIDYVKANKKILHLAVKHLCEIYIPVPVLKEVKDISRGELEKLGINIFEPTIDHLIQAAQKPFGVSFEDQLCLLIAKKMAGFVRPMTNSYGFSVKQVMWRSFGDWISC